MKFSFFRAPISPWTDRTGRRLEATTRPEETVHLSQFAEMIRSDRALVSLTEQVRASKDADALRKAKARLLPYVTPVGVFTKRRGDAIESYSGLLPVDIDKAKEGLDLEEAKRWIFDMYAPYVKLAFVSPSGRGIKLFVSVGPFIGTLSEALREELLCSWSDSIRLDFADDLMVMDTAGKDLARACFLCHDPNVLYRE